MLDIEIFYGGNANEVISDNGYFLSKGWSAEVGQPKLSTNKWRLLGNANSTFTFTHFAGCESAAETRANTDTTVQMRPDLPKRRHRELELLRPAA